MVRTLITLLVLAANAFAQTPPAFDVASVKPLDQATEGRTGMDFRVQPGGRLDIVNLTLEVIIREAFHVKHYQISGGPAWLSTDHFNIAAKAVGDPSREQMMAMLQTLLEDRFQLKVHRETREGNVYALVVAKGGPKLTGSTADQPQMSLYRNDPPGVSYTIVGKKASLSKLAEELTSQLARPVLDRTGIQGEFDFKLGPFAGDDNVESGASLLSVIQQQLGLKLEAVKGSIETLVIDHAEKPSGN